MSRVFVLDSDRRPLMPCTSARARLLLRRRRAAVLRRFPFTIILKASRPDAQVQPLRLKLDPGSRRSGLAIVNDASQRPQRRKVRGLSKQAPQLTSPLSACRKEPLGRKA